MCTDLEDGNVRLVDGPSAYEGRVEICSNRQWGTICNRYWSANDAVVVCRQLGFSVAGNEKFYCYKLCDDAILYNIHRSCRW